MLDSTLKSNDLEQMKSAEFGREKTPDFNEDRKNESGGSSGEMKKNIDSMLDAQFAKEMEDNEPDVEVGEDAINPVP